MMQDAYAGSAGRAQHRLTRGGARQIQRDHPIRRVVERVCSRCCRRARRLAISAPSPELTPHTRCSKPHTIHLILLQQFLSILDSIISTVRATIVENARRKTVLTCKRRSVRVDIVLNSTSRDPRYGDTYLSLIC